ncbi:alpha/beta fold hydrolase [Legionella impletisoli]|uniref:Lipolytic protein n=1 Tax=Legionella impletisoli TaxID=343510 RepID=A0A917K1T4_9GAMM|nr:alpha/beta fold hydrolase [Legionella impletisoli]GGI93203.1 lipolytic protein [Legionella impletisoli]
MARVKVNDIELYYETHGTGEAIVFISGFSADHTLWREVVDRFKKNYQVILFDNRGVGRTDVPLGEYTITQMAEDVAALCSHLDLAKANFIGNSMGGFILQTLMHRYPHLIKTAVISNSASTINSCYKIYLASQLEFLKANVPMEALVKASCSWVYSYQFLAKEKVFNNLIQLALDNPYPFTIAGYHGQYAALKGFNSEPWLKSIQIPTLVIGSDQDLIFRESSIKALSEQLPNATYYSFKECGHLPPLEYPKKFYELVRGFLADNCK